MSKMNKAISIRMDFDVIKLPPVRDILVLGKRVPQGKYGVIQSFDFLAPDTFEMIDVPNSINESVDAVIVNKAILKRIPREKLMSVLAEHVFPFVSAGEAVRVDFTVTTSVVINEE